MSFPLQWMFQMPHIPSIACWTLVYTAYAVVHCIETADLTTPNLECITLEIGGGHGEEDNYYLPADLAFEM
jgi:hypothetical protein